MEGAWNRKYSEVSPELGGSWSPKNVEGIQGWSWKDSKMFSEQKTGCPLCVIVFYVHNVEVFFDYLVTNIYGHMGSVVDHQLTTNTCQLQCNRLFQGKCLNAHGLHEFWG